MLFMGLAALFCVIVNWRYAIFRNDVDLGLFTQVITSLGRGFSSTAEGGVNHLLVHWSPIVVVAWPFVRTIGPVGLEYVQAILVAATIFPVWALARTRFGSRGAFAIAAAAALYPILWANAVGDFHEMAFVPLLSATLVYALDRRRWTLAVVAALLLACTKEDQFVILCANGLLFAFVSRDDARARRIGLLIAGLAVAMALVYFGIVRPALNPHVGYQAVHFFDWRAADHGSPAGVLRSRLWYVAIVLAPLAFLPCISRYGLFLIVGFAEMFASSQPVTLVPGAHYSGLLTGYALPALVDGAFRLRQYGSRVAQAAVLIAAAVSIVVNVFASPMEYWYYLYRRPNAQDALLEQTLRQLPPKADVGAEDEIFAHLGRDPNASVNFKGQKWFVYDVSHYSERWQKVDAPNVRAALQRHAFIIVTNREGIVVIRRSALGI